jgi:hypothetical protein
MEAGHMHGGFRRSSSLTRDGNTLQKPPSFNRSSSINSNASNQIVLATAAAAALQKPSSFKEGQTPQEPAEQQQDLWQCWKQQFMGAIEYDSKAAEEGEEPGGALGLVLHFMSIFWKLASALAPPAWWLGGWPCFCGCLLLIILEVGGWCRCSRCC